MSTHTNVGPAPEDVTYGLPRGKSEADSQEASVEVPSRSTETTTQQAGKNKRQAPAGAILPDRGVRKAQYTVNVALRRPDKVPPISHAQWRNEMIKELQGYVAMGVRPVISLANIKSGTKTRTATNLAGFLSKYGGLRVLVLPTTMNSATASLAQMVGFEDGDTITLDDLVVRRNEFKRYFALTSVLKKFTIDQFMVASEGVNDASEEDDKWGVSDWVEMLRIVRSHFDVVILDHANDSVKAGRIGPAAVRMSDVVMLVQNGQDSVTKTTLKKTFDGYKTDPFEGLTTKEIVEQGLVGMYEDAPEELMVLPGELIPTWDKIRSAIVVSSRTTPKKWPEDQIKLILRAPDQKGTSSVVREWNGVSRTIPNDEYISQDGSVCDISKLGKGTFDAFLELTILVMARAAEVKRQSDERWESVFPDVLQVRKQYGAHRVNPGISSTDANRELS